MEEKEKIPVFILIVNGKTECICHAHDKGCGRNCKMDTVERDKFCRWYEEGFKRNRYGK